MVRSRIYPFMVDNRSPKTENAKPTTRPLRPRNAAAKRAVPQ